MFQLQKDNSQYLYHYTKAETAINFILKDKTLKFSNFNATNDPKESKSWLFSPGTNENRDLSKYSPEYLSQIMNPQIKAATHLLCFSMDKKLTGNHLNDMANRGFCKPRMWAQYGENHTGVCLIFDMKILTESMKSNLSDKHWDSNPVVYRDRLLAEMQSEPAFIVNIDKLEEWGEEEYAFSHSQYFKNRLFFEKASDWENENEFRWVLFDSKDDIYLKYQNALKGIVFGEYCSEDTINEIVGLTKNAGVQYQQLKWRNCTPWYNFDRLRWT